MTGICDRLATEAEARHADPEAVEVTVVSCPEALAREVAPLLAARLFPGRTFGEVLHIEPAVAGWHVAVRDLGPHCITTRGVPPPMRRR